MSIQEVITILQNKLTGLQNARSAFIGSGNLEPLNQIDLDIIEVTSTLAKIQSLQ